MRYKTLGTLGILYNDTDGHWWQVYRLSNGNITQLRCSDKTYGVLKPHKAIPETHPFFNITMVSQFYTMDMAESLMYHEKFQEALNNREDLPMTLEELLNSP